MGTPTKPRKRLAWVCPAPKRYQKSQEADDDEEVVGLVQAAAPVLPNLDDGESENALTQTSLPEPTSHSTRLSSIGSLDSVELPPAPSQKASTASSSVPSNEKTHGSLSSATEKSSSSSPSPPLEYDLKHKAKMISLSKIRPTIGMNLGKVELCQAKCHVWDLGGRLVDLWERYYADCDAVVFVWKLGPDHVVPEDDEDEDDLRPVITYDRQLEMLTQVRGAIGDDIPFLILAHAFGEHEVCPVPTGLRFQTKTLLPHYHNPLQTMMVANAATGQGVQAAIEWLVPLAKRQQAVRERSLEKLP
jgi:hypothetical protein